MPILTTIKKINKKNSKKQESEIDALAKNQAEVDNLLPLSKKQKVSSEDIVVFKDNELAAKDENQVAQALIGIKQEHSKIDSSKLVFINAKNPSDSTNNDKDTRSIKRNTFYILLKCAIQFLEDIVELENQNSKFDSENSENLAFLQTEMDDERFKSGILNKKIAQLLLQYNITDPTKVISLNSKY
jgi:hypothetical protein